MFESLEELRYRQGWTDATLLNLALDYIADQNEECRDGFIDFLTVTAKQENDEVPC